MRGLFQGHSATLLRIFPYAGIKFMAYDWLERVSGDLSRGLSVAHVVKERERGCGGGRQRGRSLRCE